MLHKFHYSSISSTQDQAKNLIKDRELVLQNNPRDNSVAIITADAQTEGRGRYGKFWSSPEGAGIYVTFVQNCADCKIGVSFADTFTVSVAEILKKQLEKIFTNYVFDIKPINDIYYQGSKLAGILVETFSYANQVYVLTGIGINLEKSTYIIKEQIPGDPKASPIALAEIIANKWGNFDRGIFLEDIAKDLVKLSNVYT